ncbi:MAG: S41 family peptidase [Candidatus Ratteibacteria bacterium]|nr:S41 family peptidase [Candidatus Ratteibacteria bacterium]
MKKRIIWSIIGLFSLAIIVGGDVKAAQVQRQKEEVYKNIELFLDVMKVVETQYVEPVDNKKLIYGALKGMLGSLDPYSAFLEPELTQELQIETKGEFHGVGMEITSKDGIITVVSPIEDTPAWKAGIKAGDRIIEIDGEPTKGITTLEAARKLRGNKGTEVTVSILKEGASELKKVTLVRDVIKVKSVKEEIIDENIGYIRVRDFQERTAADLSKALENFNKKDIKGIILDLRNNPGGLLTSAIEVSELFVPKGRTIVSVQGREEKDKTIFNSRKKPLWEGKIVLLINEGSASASEILVGALKDNLPETVAVGMKTFGKGSVQNLVPLSDGSSLKLTTAHYYTPSGICIEGKGIEPDISIQLPEDTTIIPMGEGDVQFQKALETLKKMVSSKNV